MNRRLSACLTTLPALAIAAGILGLVASAVLAAPADAGTLSHPPIFGPTGDVTFSIPTDHAWTDAGQVAGLSTLLPTGTLGWEQPLITLRALNNPGGPYVYLEAIAVDLSEHPDVQNVAELANLKLRFVQNDSSSFQLVGAQDAIVDGVPAKIADTVETRDFPDGATLTDIAAQAPSDETVDTLRWTTHDVFVVRGNWGYDVRLFSIDPDVTTGYVQDLNQLIGSLHFNY